VAGPERRQSLKVSPGNVGPALRGRRSRTPFMFPLAPTPVAGGKEHIFDRGPPLFSATPCCRTLPTGSSSNSESLTFTAGRVSRVRLESEHPNDLVELSSSPYCYGSGPWRRASVLVVGVGRSSAGVFGYSNYNCN